MGIKKSLLVVVIAALAAFPLLGCAVWRPIGTVTLVQPPLSPATEGKNQHTYDSGIEAYAFVTGWVQAPAYILIDQQAAGLPDHLKKAQWVPSVAYMVRHPEQGVVVLDTGLRAGECAYGLRPIYWVPCRHEPGDDLVSQLETLGVRGEDVRYIIASHLHGDHISGLDALLRYTGAPVAVTTKSLEDLQSPFRALYGVPPEMLARDMNALVIDERWHPDPALGQSFDVFGDGSLLLFETPGHTKGHISAVLELETDMFLLTFDAAHLRANLSLQIPSGSVASRDDAVASLAALQTLADQRTDATIIYGHEPTQWACVDGLISLVDLGRECAPAITR
ncbi:MAG: N-acyl homoserine lactonase family protein [Pseudomonadota bacterium]